MTVNNLIPILSIGLLMVKLQAQTPPMPPMPTASHVHYVTNVTAVPCTRTRYWGITQYGKVVDLGRVCDAHTNDFESHTVVSPEGGLRFVLRASDPPVVVQQNLDTPIAPAGTPGVGTSMQTWTTDPNLRLSIQLTNYSIPLIFGITLTQTNGSYLTGSTNVVQGKAVVIKYPTEIGKTYMCQASDDAKKTWIDGVPVVGTGHLVMQYEAAIKTNRIYRVIEL